MTTICNATNKEEIMRPFKHAAIFVVLSFTVFAQQEAMREAQVELKAKPAMREAQVEPKRNPIQNEAKVIPIKTAEDVKEATAIFEEQKKTFGCNLTAEEMKTIAEKHLKANPILFNSPKDPPRHGRVILEALHKLDGKVENADKIRKLSGTLSTMMDDYFQALKQSKGIISLPVDGYSVTYDKLNKLTWLTGMDFKIRLQEAASGFQSLIPMMIVSNYLLNQITENKGENILNLKSVEERERIAKNIQKLLKDKELDDNIRLELIKQYQTELYNHRFINIVEEPEQNLFPKSQRNVLNELLRINNSIKENLFIFTTHSPYIINYLTLAIKAGILCQSLSSVSEAKERIEKIVPGHSAVLSKDVVIYQFTEDGEIKMLPKYESLPSDDNFLNNSLFESNQLFEKLLEIEDEYKTC